MFGRIAIVNRGEAAVRLVRAVRELNSERGLAITTIALHTEAERGALFVRMADEAVQLRPSATARSPYLDHAELARALKQARADAVWVGWGFVAEDPAFAELCADIGITFIGPPPEAMRRLGDKIEAKLLAEEVGVPVAPWSGGPVETLAEAEHHAEIIGYPLIIKARSGGGGRGIRIVRDPADLADGFERTQSEAQTAFADPVVFIERVLEGCRHVEVQVIADDFGTDFAPGVRDCSIQRRNQKLIEESSSPVLTKEQSAQLRKASASLVKAAGYRGAGTVEYLYQPEEKMFTFLEVNTRLQVEHPITEITTGFDLVKAQITVAAGEPLPDEPPVENGHAVEARLNAEDADNGFAPAPGSVALLKLPSGPGIRVDTGIASGDNIPPEYDSMVAKIIAWGRDRPEAMSRLRCALRDTTVVIRGGTTIKGVLLSLLERPEVIDGSADTQWIDRVGVETILGPQPNADIAMLAVAVQVYEDDELIDRDHFLASASGGRPRASQTFTRSVELRYQGGSYTLDVSQVGPHAYRVRVNDNSVEVSVDRFGQFEGRISVGGTTFPIVLVPGPAGFLVDVDGASYRVLRDEAGVVRAPAPGVVVAVRVAAGDTLSPGDAVAVLESMKMETPVVVAYGGRVREVLVSVNSQVDSGAPLLRLDPEIDEDAGPTSALVSFDRPVGGGEGTELAQLRALMTGYDVSDADARGLIRAYLAGRDKADPAAVVADEMALLLTFADLCELSRNRPTRDEGSSNEALHSPREHLHVYLQSLDIERDGLPESFRGKLVRMLAHYGVQDLEPTNELQEAVYRLFLAQDRSAAQAQVVSAILEQWLSNTDQLRQYPNIGDALQRVVLATQLRSPVVGELARSVRYQIVDLPGIIAARHDVHEGMRTHLDALAADPNAADRAQRIDALVNAPEPLLALLGEQLRAGGSRLDTMLEVLARRTYRTRTLEDFRAFDVDGHPVVTASLVTVAPEPDGERVQLVETVSDFAGLHDTGRIVAEVGSSYTNRLVVDIYLAWDSPAEGDELAAELQSVAREMPLPERMRRVTFAVSRGTGESLTFFTFRPGDEGLVEDRPARGVHPLMTQRLHLWRWSNFDLARIPAAEDVHLYQATAQNNPDDVRLVALALVRDVRPSLDTSGRAVGFPALERILAACTDGIRRARAGQRGLDYNEVSLFVRPPIQLPPDQLLNAAKVLLPITVGAGITEIQIFGHLEPPGVPGADVVLQFSYQEGAGVRLNVTYPSTEPVAPVDEYEQKVRRARARGTVFPYEILPMLTGPNGTWTELDFEPPADGAPAKQAAATATIPRLVPVERAMGRNASGIVVALITTPTARYPEGMTRVALFGDPTKALGSVAEPECARVCAALDLAEEMGVPVEWFALSSGARISMDSGTENMDWVARALRRIITFTQGGGEINVVVAGINVGAQPYWNAEATMLMHTKGILVMTPDSAMVLTGKQSLDYSGGVSAEDNFGIGGYDRVMGPNGQAQYWAPDLAGAVYVLFAHYEHAYRVAGERFPRRALTIDPLTRDVRDYPHEHPASDFATVGEVFDKATNGERKKPFDIRTIMASVIDQDHPPLERWAQMFDADTSVVLDAHLGGWPCTVLGIESRPVPRRGYIPTDGPDQYTAGTLFPRSSTKTARAINAASGNRPLVVLANLSGFDGSPESLRKWQLEYGAEIGRAVVNFDGPIIFCVISRYHGGAFVVFSGALNDAMEVVAVEGSFASVIGGAPAAAVVFTGDVNRRTAGDPRVTAVQQRLADADESERAHLRVELAETRESVRSEKLGEVATEFEAIHTIERARQVGSVHTIISAEQLRPYLIDAIERGVTRTLGG